MFFMEKLHVIFLSTEHMVYSIWQIQQVLIWYAIVKNADSTHTRSLLMAFLFTNTALMFTWIPIWNLMSSIFVARDSNILPKCVQHTGDCRSNILFILQQFAWCIHARIHAQIRTDILMPYVHVTLYMYPIVSDERQTQGKHLVFLWSGCYVV